MELVGDWELWSVDRSGLIVFAGDVESNGSDCSANVVVRQLEVGDHGQNGSGARLSGISGGRSSNGGRNRCGAWVVDAGDGGAWFYSLFLDDFTLTSYEFILYVNLDS